MDKLWLDLKTPGLPEHHFTKNALTNFQIIKKIAWKQCHPSITVCLFHDSWCINRETAMTYRMSQNKEPQPVMNGRLKKWIITTIIHQHVSVHTDVHLCTEHAVRLHVGWFIAAEARSIKLHTHKKSEKEWFITLKNSSSPTWLPIFTLNS